MFLKLLKHDLISLKNSFFILFIITICVGLIAPFLIFSIYKFALSSEEVLTIGYILLFGIYSLVICFILVIIILYIINSVRFFKQSFFSSQGYLTLTLPISTGKNVISKLLSIILWGIAFTLVGIVSLFISALILNTLIAYNEGADVSIFTEIKNFFTPSTNIDMRQVGINILSAFSSFFTSILMLCGILLVITLGNVKPFKNHPVFFSIIFAIGLFFIYSIGITNINTLIPDLIIMNIINILLELAFIILGVFLIVKLIDNKVEIS